MTLGMAICGKDVPSTAGFGGFGNERDLPQVSVEADIKTRTVSLTFACSFRENEDGKQREKSRSLVTGEVNARLIDRMKMQNSQSQKEAE